MATIITGPDTQSFQARTNQQVWERGAFVRRYANRTLRPAEVFALVRHREHFAGRVLELGVGAGRFTGYLVEIGAEVHGIDISEAMVEYCRRAYPSGQFEVADLRDLDKFSELKPTVVVATNNVLDVLDDAERRRCLEHIFDLLEPGGLLAMSAHNRDYEPVRRALNEMGPRDIVRTGRALAMFPVRMRNHRRLAAFERDETEYAIRNDEAHHYSLLHYYISRSAQERQLAEAGFQVLECMTSEGELPGSGDTAASCGELHYIARRPQSDD